MKKGNGIRRMISTVMVVVLGLGLSSCGKNETAPTPDTSLAKQYVYSYEELDITGGGNEIIISSTIQQNDRLYMIAEIYDWY